MKKPNLKMKKPGKKIGIKNRFLKKNLISLITIAVLLIGTGTAYGTLSSRDADRGEDTVYGINTDRYQILVSGNGYKLSKQQEKQYKLQKKQNEVNAANDFFSRPTNPFYNQNPRYQRPHFPGHTYTTTKNPRVATNISEQISMKKNWKSGDKLQFRVTAFAYPYGAKNVISSDGIKISVTGGNPAKEYMKQKGSIYYEVKLNKGKNTITIQVTDKKNKKTAKLGPYTVTAEKDSGSGTDPEINFTVTATADLSEFGLEPITFESKVTSKKTTAYDVLKKNSAITFSGKDIQYISGDMSAFSLDGYSIDALQEIYRLESGETGSIDESVFEAWIDEVEQSVRDSGKLGTGFPFESSSWTYDKTLKGEALASGITLIFNLYDGLDDEL